MTNTIKFSQFVTASLNQQSATVVGVENGVNYKSQRFLVWTIATRPATPFNGLLGFNTDLQQYEYWDAVALAWIQLSIEGIDILSLLASHLPGEGASLVGLQNQPNVINKTLQDLANASFVVNTSNGSLQNQQVLGLLTTGILKSTTVTGIISISAPLTSIDGLVTVANQMIYTTAPNTYATTTFTPLARSLMSDLTTEDMRTTLGIAPLTNGQLIIGVTGGNPARSTLTQGSGITISNGPGTITISSSGGGLAWEEVTTATKTIAINTGYIVNRPAGVVFSLPATMLQGGLFAIVGKVGAWSIQAAGAQQIGVGLNVSSAGGSLSSANDLDSGEWVCTTADLLWSTVGAPETAGFIIT